MALGIESAVPLLYRGLTPNTDLPFLVGVKRGANWYRFDFDFVLNKTSLASADNMSIESLRQKKINYMYIIFKI